MSKMEPVQSMTNARNEGLMARAAWSLFATTCVFLMQGGNLAAEFKKTDKIDCQSPRAKLGIGKLRSAVLTVVTSRAIIRR